MRHSPRDGIKRDILMPVVKYMTLLYGDEQYVWAADYLLQKHFSMTKEQAILQYIDRSFEKGAYIAVNAAKQLNINKTSENVFVLRNFLIEFDQLPLEEQIPFMKKLGLPYSACIYSGGKSYHFIISLKEPLFHHVGELKSNGLLQYKDIFYRIHFLCEEKNDRACSDPARFTRFPNAFRAGTVQQIVEIFDRIDNSELFEIIYSPAFEEKYKQTKWHQIFQKDAQAAPQVVNRADIVKKLDWYVNNYLGLSTEIGGKLQVACPCCREEGGDNHGDNLHITGPDALFHCFKDPEMHNDKILIAIDKLMQEAGTLTKKPEFTINKTDNLIDWSNL
jgi:hypothetical protein